MSPGVVLALVGAGAGAPFGLPTPLEARAQEACVNELGAYYARVRPDRKIGFGRADISYIGSSLRLTWSDDDLAEARPDLSAIPLGDTAICMVKPFDRTIAGLTVNGAPILSTEKKF